MAWPLARALCSCTGRSCPTKHCHHHHPHHPLQPPHLFWWDAGRSAHTLHWSSSTLPTLPLGLKWSIKKCSRPSLDSAGYERLSCTHAKQAAGLLAPRHISHTCALRPLQASGRWSIQPDTQPPSAGPAQEGHQQQQALIVNHLQDA
jgi:hypothetical protein